MIRRFTFIGISVLLLTSISFGQAVKKTGGLSRLSSMGANVYVQDPFFMTLNPAWGAVYNDFVFLDLGLATGGQPFNAGGRGQFFAGSFSIGNNLTIGGILSRNDFPGIGIGLLDPTTNIFNNVTLPFQLPPFGVVAIVNNLNPSASVVNLDNNMEVMGTYKIKNTTVGFGFAYASTSNDVTPDTGSGTANSASQIGFNAGVLHALSKKLLLDAGASLILPSATYEPVTGSNTEASQTIIMVNARAFYDYSSKVSFVPVFAFMNISGSSENGGANSVSFDLPSVTLISFGFGVSYKVGDFLLAGGPSFSNLSITTAAVDTTFPELTSSIRLFPVWNIGLEWNMLDWLVGRVGYIAITGSSTIETAVETTRITESVSTFFLPSQRGISLGVGFRFGDFSLDAIVNEDVLRQGFNNIGGGGGTFYFMSMGYALP